MKSNKKRNKEAIECLPRIEWDYSDIPESVLSAAFFWEYSRRAKFVREKVEFVRGLGFLENSNYCRLNPKYGDEKENLKLVEELEQLEGSPFYSVICSMAERQYSFADSNIRDVGGYGGDRFLNSVQRIFHPEPLIKRLDPGVKHEVKWGSDGESMTLTCDEGNGLWTYQRDESQALLLVIPNTIGRNELLGRLIGELEGIWPSEHRCTFEKTEVFKGVGGVSLGFSKRTALEWLGVLKRFEHVGNSWSRYFELYPELGDNESTKRKLRERCGKAREIIKWFDGGGSGRVVASNNGRTLRWEEGLPA